jgi:hypothetical protein
MMHITFLIFGFFVSNIVVLNATVAQESKVFISAAYLHQICARDENGAEKMAGGHTACQAYIAGVIDYHNLLKTLGTAPSVDICITNTAKPSDLQDVVWNYLDKNAQHDAFAAAPAITLALAQVFPCKKRKR